MPIAFDLRAGALFAQLMGTWVAVEDPTPAIRREFRSPVLVPESSRAPEMIHVTEAQAEAQVET